MKRSAWVAAVIGLIAAGAFFGLRDPASDARDRVALLGDGSAERAPASTAPADPVTSVESVESGPTRAVAGEAPPDPLAGEGLEIPPVLAAGVVVDEDGVPVRGALVGVAAFKARRKIQSETDEHGRFELRSSEPHTQLELDVSKQGCVRWWTFDGEPGRTDWNIELRRAGRMVVQLDVPPGTDCEGCAFSIRSGDADSASSRSFIGSFEEDGTVAWDDCAPGTYIVTVTAHDELLVRLDQVVVRAGETREVGPIRFPRGGGVLELTVVGPDDAPLESGFYAAGTRGSELIEQLWTTMRPQRLQAGKLRVVRSSRSFDVAVAAPGLRTRVFHDVQQGAVLQLERGIPTILAVENTVSRAPEGAVLKLGLVRADVDGHSSLEWYASAIDERGEAAILAPEPGKYRLRWILERPGFGGSTWPAWEDPPQHIEVLDSSDPQRFDVVCPTDPSKPWG